MSRNSENYSRNRNNIRGGSRYGYCMDKLEYNIRALNKDESKRATPELIKDAITVTKVEDKYTNHPQGEVCDPAIYKHYNDEIKKAYGISVGGNNRYNGDYDRHNGGYDNYYSRNGGNIVSDFRKSHIFGSDPNINYAKYFIDNLKEAENIATEFSKLGMSARVHIGDLIIYAAAINALYIYGDQITKIKMKTLGPKILPALFLDRGQSRETAINELYKNAPGIMAFVEDKPHRGGYDRHYYNRDYNNRHYDSRDYNRDYYPNSMHGGALGILRDELGIKIMNNLRDEILQIEL
jgi:hypothetical protein